MKKQLSISTLASCVLLFGMVIGFSYARAQQFAPQQANTIECQIYSPGGSRTHCTGAYR